MAHDPLEYLQSVLHRSTSYTYRMPFKIDASIANADERAFAAYSRLGEEIGLAFHVIDDQLNVAPVTEEWSKTTAEDIAAGTVTLQVLLILQRADRNRAAELVRILRASTTDQRELRNAVASCGSVGRSPRRGQSQISTRTPACASSPTWTSSTARIASCGAVLYHNFRTAIDGRKHPYDHVR